MEEQNFILQEVIDELTNSQKSLLGPLMKLNYFGRLIKNNELTTFTSKEIKGYQVTDEIPDYRRTYCRIVAYVKNRFVEQNIEIPVSAIEDPFNESLQFIRIYDGISVLERMIKQMEAENRYEFYKPIPIQLLYLIQPIVDKMFPNYGKLYVQSAQSIGNANIFLEASNSIREKLLELAIKIGEEFGYNIEIMSFKSNPEKNNQIINNIMNNTINNNGDGNVINTGNENTISNTNTISKGNVDTLRKKLQENGIEETDIDEIIKIVETEEPIDNEIGEKSKNWIMKIMEKSMNGIGKIAIGASGNLLATFIKGYYGIM